MSKGFVRAIQNKYIIRRRQFLTLFCVWYRLHCNAVHRGHERGPVPKRRFQKGTLVKRRGNWVGMWRIDVLQPNGTTRREQRSQTFIGLSERAARAAFQPILDAVNAANHATPPVPKTSDTVAKAVREWQEHAAESLKPSTLPSVNSHLRP